MKHGRPERHDWTDGLTGDIGYTESEYAEDYSAGWRREHASRVWQTMQCMVMIADAWNQGAIHYLIQGRCPDWVRP